MMNNQLLNYIFSEWLLEKESIILPTIEETDLAVILHTSSAAQKE
jgi:hypothetical protein